MGKGIITAGQWQAASYRYSRDRRVSLVEALKVFYKVMIDDCENAGVKVPELPERLLQVMRQDSPKG